MATMDNYDLAIIGSGPGGYVSAIRASQLGMKVAIIEKDSPGGVCLNIGCIPSKSIIHQATLFMELKEMKAFSEAFDPTKFDYANVYTKSRDAATSLSKGVTFLLRKNNVDYLKGHARIAEKHIVQIDNGATIQAKNILIASGARPKSIPGFEFDGRFSLSSTDLLMLKKLPKKLIILGAGYIGMEFAHVMNAFGVDVAVVEMLDRIVPTADIEIANILAKSMTRRGVKILTSHRATQLVKKSDSVSLSLRSAHDKSLVIDGDQLLVAIGRTPNSEELGLENVGIVTDRGFIPTRDYYQTSVDNIYAIGDVISSPMLAHVASGEGELAVSHMAGESREAKLDPDEIPGAIFTQPEMASFGPTEEQLQNSSIKYKKSTFPYRGAGKSVAIGHPDGIIKLLYQQETKEILAAHIIGVSATEIIHELLLAKRCELLPENIATMIHAHPTISETIMEVARGAEGWMIHS